jgi:transposase
MRNSFDGLSGIVTNQLHRNPMNGDVFIFINKRHNCIKMLRWEPGGFVLYYKRLETGTFEFPELEPGNESLQITWSSLMLMTEGISLKDIKRRKRFLLKNRDLSTQILSN